jgi:hypothetical protein
LTKTEAFHCSRTLLATVSTGKRLRGYAPSCHLGQLQQPRQFRDSSLCCGWRLWNSAPLGTSCIALASFRHHVKGFPDLVQHTGAGLLIPMVSKPSALGLAGIFHTSRYVWHRDGVLTFSIEPLALHVHLALHHEIHWHIASFNLKACRCM